MRRRLGVATTILMGAVQIASGRTDFLVLFMSLLVISRIYAPFDQSLALVYEPLSSHVSSARLQRFFDESLATAVGEWSIWRDWRTHLRLAVAICVECTGYLPRHAASPHVRLQNTS